MRMQDVLRDGDPSNFTEVNCEWFDEVTRLQNKFYWRHRGAENIIVLYVLICAFGAIANLFVIASFLRTPQIQNLRNYFIANLAVSDLLLCTVTAPVTVYFTVNLFWPFGTLACQVTASMQAVNMFVSCLTLVLIAMDRFLLTLCPVKWRMAARAPVACYAVVWLTAVLVATPYFFAVTAEDVTLDPWHLKNTDKILEICDRSKPQICIERTWHRLPFSRRTYTLTVLGIQYLLPLCALVFAYSQIGSTIRRRTKHSTVLDQQRRHLLLQRNRRAVLLLLSLVLIYGICWLPIQLYNVLNVLEVIDFSQSRYIFCHMIGMCSACLNPIMYGLINESFRNAFLDMLRPFFAPCSKYLSVKANPTVAPPTTFTYAPNRKNCTDSPAITARKDTAPPTDAASMTLNLISTPFIEPLLEDESDQYC
uniref:G_PROTEIN_RECEP_F1_2 domain-containing protein n=1 Tax=Panagrellus redivivus TaxID=6233 RepID=A0A7E4UL28_PANRE